MKKIALAALLAAFLAGCSTTYNQQDVQPVPQSQLLEFQAPIENAAIVQVTRLANLGGGFCRFAFLIDDKLAGTLSINEQTRFYVPAGEHKVQVTADWTEGGLCGALLSEESCRGRGQIRTTNFEANKIYDIRIGFNSAPFAGVFRLYLDDHPKTIETK